MDHLEKLKSQISKAREELEKLQFFHRRETGKTFEGMHTWLSFDVEFSYDENFAIRFNNVPVHTEGPESIEIVQILFYGEPLTLAQESAFIEEHKTELEEMCIARKRQHGPLPLSHCIGVNKLVVKCEHGWGSVISAV